MQCVGYQNKYDQDQQIDQNNLQDTQQILQHYEMSNQYSLKVQLAYHSHTLHLKHHLQYKLQSRLHHQLTNNFKCNKQVIEQKKQIINTQLYYQIDKQKLEWQYAFSLNL